MNLSHEEYLKQFQQSRLLAEQRTNLYGPFNTVPMGMPGGNNQTVQGHLFITIDATNSTGGIDWCVSASEPTTFTIDWGDGNIEEFEVDGDNCFSYDYAENGVYNVIITFDDPSLITEFDFND
jgi:hypothetical protein